MLENFFPTALDSDFIPGTGIKIDQVDTLTSRGYDRLRISSRAIEAYLIQVHHLGSLRIMI